MGKSLVIVESPAKAKTINRYLGDDFVVKSSVGHVRDLPVSGGAKTSTPKERAKEAAYTRSLPKEEREAYKKKKARAQLINRMGVDPDHRVVTDHNRGPSHLADGLANRVDVKVLALDKELGAVAVDVFLGRDQKLLRYCARCRLYPNRARRLDL